jgi:hypothetical protein
MAPWGSKAAVAASSQMAERGMVCISLLSRIPKKEMDKGRKMPSKKSSNQCLKWRRENRQQIVVRIQMVERRILGVSAWV